MFYCDKFLSFLSVSLIIRLKIIQRHVGTCLALTQYNKNTIFGPTYKVLLRVHNEIVPSMHAGEMLKACMFLFSLSFGRRL